MVIMVRAALQKTKRAAVALSAAMLGDSAVVTWSQGAYGGDSGAVEDEQRNE